MVKFKQNKKMSWWDFDKSVSTVVFSGKPSFWDGVLLNRENMLKRTLSDIGSLKKSSILKKKGFYIFMDF